jgi:4-hydroxy-tetrahydrodipicolinate synthase
MRGVYTALVTPFDSKNEIDWPAYRALLKAQKEAGIAGVIPCGTTGESPTLDESEKKQLIEEAVAEMKGSKTAVFAGTGSNDTEKTVEFSKWASGAGVQGVLIVAPYYNKPTQAGLLAHFRAVADAVSCTVMVYNIPGRTGISIAPGTLAQLSKHPRIRALKESSGSLFTLSDIQDAIALEGNEMDYFCGDDGLFVPMLSVGACGVVSVASNVIPKTMVQLQSLFDAGKSQQAADLHRKLYPLFRDLFIEANPGPVKQIMAWNGRCSPHVRLPLVGMAEENQAKLKKTVSKVDSAIGGLQ